MNTPLLSDEEMQELIANLKYYQMWRRGIDGRIPQPSPADITTWIYQAIEVLEEVSKKKGGE